MRSHFIVTGITVLTILTSGCSSLTELPMYWGNNPASSTIKPTGYHADTKTGWMSYNDSTHMYFAFSFFDPRFQTRVLTTGMTVFVDTTGKMKEGCFVRFPLIKREIISGGGGQKIQPRQGAQRQRERTSTEMLLEQAQGFELQWAKGKDTIQVNPSTDKTGFKTSIGLDSANALNMVIGIPLRLIQPAGMAALDDMVIGLRFGQIQSGQGQAGGRQQSSGVSQQAVLGGANAGTAGSAGSGGRGRRGGGGGGNAGGSGAGGGNAGGGNARMNAGGDQGGMDNSPVEFWYKTRLIRK